MHIHIINLRHQLLGQEHPAILARFCDPSEGTWQRKMWWSSRVSVAKWAEIRLVSDGIFVDRVLGFIRHIPWTTMNNPCFLTVTKLFPPCLMNMRRNNWQLANDLVPALLLLCPRKKKKLLTPHSDLTICLIRRRAGHPALVLMDDLYHSYP